VALEKKSVRAVSSGDETGAAGAPIPRLPGAAAHFPSRKSLTPLSLLGILSTRFL
jgi:hypothetical protein